MARAESRAATRGARRPARWGPRGLAAERASTTLESRSAPGSITVTSELEQFTAVHLFESRRCAHWLQVIPIARLLSSLSRGLACGSRSSRDQAAIRTHC